MPQFLYQQKSLDSAQTDPKQVKQSEISNHVQRDIKFSQKLTTSPACALALGSARLFSARNEPQLCDCVISSDIHIENAPSFPSSHCPIGMI